MKQRLTFAGWDFADDAGDGTDDIWKIREGVTYPLLAWQAWQKYGGGAGTGANPYQIWTAEHMNTIGLNEEDWDKHFVLTADIDLGGYTGTEYNIIAPDTDSEEAGFQGTAFTGVFDGKGHSIEDFTYTGAGDVMLLDMEDPFFYEHDLQSHPL